MMLGVFLQEHTKEFTPMALSESVLSELLDAFRAGEGVDLIRDAVQLVLQELIETEAVERIVPNQAFMCADQRFFGWAIGASIA